MTESGGAVKIGVPMESHEWFRQRAKQLYHEEGEVEIDDNARVSVGGKEGAYVEAWVWVPSSVLEQEKLR